MQNKMVVYDFNVSEKLQCRLIPVQYKFRISIKPFFSLLLVIIGKKPMTHDDL